MCLVGSQMNDSGKKMGHGQAIVVICRKGGGTRKMTPRTSKSVPCVRGKQIEKRDASEGGKLLCTKGTKRRGPLYLTRRGGPKSRRITANSLENRGP